MGKIITPAEFRGRAFPTIKRARGFDPRSIAGLVLWLKAGKYNPVTGDWVDSSGTNHNGTQVSPTARPTLSTSARLGGKPSVLFDGIDDFILLPKLATIPLTIICAVHPITTGGRLFETNPSPNGITLIFASNTQIAFYGQGSNISATMAAYNDTGFVLSIVHTGGIAVMRKAGAQIASGNVGAGDLNNATGAKLGSGTAGSNTNSHLPELFVYSRDLNASGEISKVEKYLGGTYGVAA